MQNEGLLHPSGPTLYRAETWGSAPAYSIEEPSTLARARDAPTSVIPMVWPSVTRRRWSSSSTGLKRAWKLLARF